MLLIYVNLINVYAVSGLCFEDSFLAIEKLKSQRSASRKTEACSWDKHKLCRLERENSFFNIKRQHKNCSFVRHMHELNGGERTHIVIIISEKILNVYNSSFMCCDFN